MSDNVINFTQKRNERDDQAAQRWLLNQGMPQRTIDLISRSLAEMYEMQAANVPNYGLFGGLQFYADPGVSEIRWGVGYSDLFPITFFNEFHVWFDQEIEAMTRGIEILGEPWESKDFEGFILEPHTKDTFEKLAVDIIDRLQGLVVSVDKTDPFVSPLIYFFIQAARNSLDVIDPIKFLAGYNADKKKYLILIQSDEERFEWHLDFTTFLQLKVSPPEE